MTAQKALYQQLISSYKIWEKLYPDYIVVAGTIGCGDFMNYLNVAYLKSYLLQTPVTIDFHWSHSKDYNFHFEDPETIIEKIDYFNSFYLKEKSEVIINHKFDSKNIYAFSQRFIPTKNNFRFHYKKKVFHQNDWVFRHVQDPIDKKIVIWNSVNNASNPRMFKRSFDRYGWNAVIEKIQSQGYKVTEIDYRTPIREVLYHISTCEATVSYEGMWHYVAKNLNKPMIVLTKDNVTKYHTPDALTYIVGMKKDHNVTYFDDFEKKIKSAKKLAENKKERMELLYGN